MKDNPNNVHAVTPMLFPFEPEEFWQSLRKIIREEVQTISKQGPSATSFETPGLSYKPLYKIEELCALFHVTKPTIYDWVKHGKLKPYKIRSRVYFLHQDIQQLLHPDSQ
jgi:excisionase family DNA binding protein